LRVYIIEQQCSLRNVQCIGPWRYSHSQNAGAVVGCYFVELHFELHLLSQGQLQERRYAITKELNVGHSFMRRIEILE